LLFVDFAAFSAQHPVTDARLRRNMKHRRERGNLIMTPITVALMLVLAVLLSLCNLQADLAYGKSAHSPRK
jgi:hypothetical protein